LQPGNKLTLKGHEVPIPDINGRADLLLKEEPDSLIVVELKVGEASREHVGQLASYVGWYKEHPEDRPDDCEDCTNVKGILLARDFSKGAESALKACPNLEKRKFVLHVEIKPDE